MNRRHQDEGAVALLAIIIMAAVLLPLAAIVIDLGQARDQRDQAQTAADSAAIAAAIALKNNASDSEALAQAQQYVAANLPDVAATFSTCATCVTIDRGSKQVVIALPSLPTLRAFSTGTSVSAQARASWALEQRGCVLCLTRDLVLGTSTRRSNVVVGPGDVDVGGRIAAAGSSRTSGGRLTVNPGTLAMIDPTQVSPPQTSTPLPLRVTAVGDPYSGSSVAADVAALASPTIPLGPTPSSTCGPLAGDIVYYRTISGCRSFRPGIYVLTDGQQQFRADPPDGVLFFATCSSGADPARAPQVCDPAASQRFASFNTAASGRTTNFAGFTGPATVDGQPRLAGQTLAIAIDPNIPTTRTQILSRITVTGDVYAPGVSVTVSSAVDVTGRFVAATVNANGTSTVTPSLRVGLDTPIQDGPVHLVR